MSEPANAKAHPHEMIDRLPDTVSWDDVRRIGAPLMLPARALALRMLADCLEHGEAEPDLLSVTFQLPA